MTTVIKIGDTVTWRSGKSKVGKKLLPLGITGCTVMAFYDIDGRAAAILDCGFFGEVNAFVEDLEPEQNNVTILSGG